MPLDQERLRALARPGLLEGLERRMVSLPAPAEPDEDAVRAQIRDTQGVLRKTLGVAPRLTGSMPLRLNVPGDVDLDFIAPIANRDRYLNAVRTLEQSAFKPSPYNRPNDAYAVFQAPEGTTGPYPVDVALAWGPEGAQYVQGRKALEQRARELPEDLRASLVEKKRLLRNTPFDIAGMRYKGFKRELDAALSGTAEPPRLVRKPLPALEQKTAYVLDVAKPEDKARLDAFLAQPHLHGHRTPHAESVLKHRRVMSGLEALHRGALKDYESGFLPGLRGQVSVPELTPEQRQELSAAFLQETPDAGRLERLEAAAGTDRSGLRAALVRHEMPALQKFLRAQAPEVAESWRMAHARIPKLSPNVFLTQGGLVGDAGYGDVGVLANVPHAQSSPYLTLVRNEAILAPKPGLKMQGIDTRKGLITGAADRIQALNEQFPDHTYVAEEHLPEQVRGQSAISIGELGRRVLPHLQEGTLRLKQGAELSETGLRTELQPHQQRVVDRLSASDQPGLVAIHGLGSGKSLSSIAAADALGGPATAVVPASLQGNYQKELEKHLTDPSKGPGIQSLQKITRNPEALRNATGTLIVDEAHRVRDPSSQGYAALKGLGGQFDKRLLMTGSPTYNHPVDLAPLVNLAAGQKLLPTAKQDFEDRYVRTRKIDPGLVARVFRGIKPGEVQELTRQKELEDIARKWVDYHSNADSADFPKRVDETVSVPMSEQQQDVYNTILGKAPAWMAYKIRHGLPPSKAESADLNAFMTGARQAQLSPHVFQQDMNPLAGATKQRAAFERLQKAIEANPEHRAVVYSNYLQAGLGPYRELLERNKIPYATFTGEMGRAEREQAVRDYNEGKLRALLLSSAGGEGLDLKGTRQIQVLEPHFNEEKLKQVIGRGIRYKSHEHLPEDQRQVLVERYLSSLPQSRLGKFFGSKPDVTADAYLAGMSKDKELLNVQLRDILARAQESHMNVARAAGQKQAMARFGLKFAEESEGPSALQTGAMGLAAASPWAGTIGRKPIIHDPLQGAVGANYKSMEELARAAKPGDVLMTSKDKGSLFKRVIDPIGGSQFYHAQPITGRSKGMGSTLSAGDLAGEKLKPHEALQYDQYIPDYVKDPSTTYNDAVLLRPKQPMKPSQRQSFLDNVGKRVTRDYDNQKAVQTALYETFVPKLDMFKNMRPETVCEGNVCSTMPAMAMHEATGRSVIPGKASQDVFPTDFLRSPEYEMVGSHVTPELRAMQNSPLRKVAPHLMRAGLGAGLAAGTYAATEEPATVAGLAGAAGTSHALDRLWAKDIIPDHWAPSHLEMAQQAVDEGLGSPATRSMLKRYGGTRLAPMLAGGALAYGGARALENALRPKEPRT